MRKDDLHSIKRKYEEGENIIQYLKKDHPTKLNTRDIIQVSYEFQGGTYIKKVSSSPLFNEEYTTAIARVINHLPEKIDSILEVGVGEATTLANLLPKLHDSPSRIFGFDLSWSRIRYALAYAQKKHLVPFLFTADLFHIPLADHSVDLVYTSHSLEPNEGREKEALLEMARVARKYIVCLEPAYDLADSEAKKRMETHGYIKNLYDTALSLGFKIIEHRLFDVYSNPLNPTGLTIIELNQVLDAQPSNPLICPITKTEIMLNKGHYFTEKGLLVYPVIDGVPCLLEDNAIIATHYLDTF